LSTFPVDDEDSDDVADRQARLVQLVSDANYKPARRKNGEKKGAKTTCTIV
jgi:hypothetical protein